MIFESTLSLALSLSLSHTHTHTHTLSAQFCSSVKVFGSGWSSLPPFSEHIQNSRGTFCISFVAFKKVKLLSSSSLSSPSSSSSSSKSLSSSIELLKYFLHLSLNLIYWEKIFRSWIEFLLKVISFFFVSQIFSNLEYFVFPTCYCCDVLGFSWENNP